MDRIIFARAVREWVTRNLDTLPSTQHEDLLIDLDAGEWGIVIEGVGAWLEYRDPLRPLSDQDAAELVELLKYMNFSSERIERLRQRLARNN